MLAFCFFSFYLALHFVYCFISCTPVNSTFILSNPYYRTLFTENSSNAYSNLHSSLIIQCLSDPSQFEFPFQGD